MNRWQFFLLTSYRKRLWQCVKRLSARLHCPMSESRGGWDSLLTFSVNPWKCVRRCHSNKHVYGLGPTFWQNSHWIRLIDKHDHCSYVSWMWGDLLWVMFIDNRFDHCSIVENTWTIYGQLEQLDGKSVETVALAFWLRTWFLYFPS